MKKDELFKAVVEEIANRVLTSNASASYFGESLKEVTKPKRKYTKRKPNAKSKTVLNSAQRRWAKTRLENGESVKVIAADYKCAWQVIAGMKRKHKLG